MLKNIVKRIDSKRTIVKYLPIPFSVKIFIVQLFLLNLTKLTAQYNPT